MKLFQLLGVLLFVFCSQNIQAQKIVKFSDYRVYQNEYGNTFLEIKPHTRLTDAQNPTDDYDKNSKVYGVLICYTLNGEQKAARQDMTWDLKTEGVYNFGLAYGKDAKVSVQRVEYFNLVDEPKEDWPAKESCF